MNQSLGLPPLRSLISLHFWSSSVLPCTSLSVNVESSTKPGGSSSRPAARPYQPPAGFKASLAPAFTVAFRIELR